jgi:hypothetical protein
MAALKRILLGQPLSSADEHHQRLSKKIALPVFASDAISSTAYATDEILVVIVLQAGVGLTAFRPLVPIAIIVCILMAIVVTSYRQTIHAYPSGGGAYIVSRENLGTPPRWSRGRRSSSTTSSRSRSASPVVCWPSARPPGSTPSGRCWSVSAACS